MTAPPIKSHHRQPSIFSSFSKWTEGRTPSTGKSCDSKPVDIHTIAGNSRTSSSGLLCALCLRDLHRQGIAELDCGHNFHSHCIENSSKCPLCGLPCRPKKPRGLIQKFIGRVRSKSKTSSRSASVYEDPRFAQSQASISSTIRRIPSILQTTPSNPPSIINLHISLKCDTLNIDAQRGGECTVLCDVSSNFTFPPSTDRSRGFDGVVLFDTCLTGRKLILAMDAAAIIVDATSSNDRLGLVVFGQEASTVSELIMCTTPYKQALQSSIQQINSTTSESNTTYLQGMKLALNLLAKDARYGGHIFLLSDGQFRSNNLDPFRSPSLTTIHVIAIGALTYRTKLRSLCRQSGSLLEYRSLLDSSRLAQLIAYIATQTYFHSIDTVRCRLTFPEQINVFDIPNHTYTAESQSQISLTLSPFSLPEFTDNSSTSARKLEALMGTLQHPLLTLTTAYSHPLLPSETQYVVTTPVQVRVKRTLGSAVRRDDGVQREVLREMLLTEWERCGEFVKMGKWVGARECLKGMTERLDLWVSKGREVNEEFHEMKCEIINCVEFVIGAEKGTLEIGVPTRKGLAIPERAIRRGETLPTRRRDTPYPHSMPVSQNPSDDGGCSSSSMKSASETKDLSHRRESEELVEEAIFRGEPVTLFHNPFLSPFTFNTKLGDTTTPRQSRIRGLESDGFSIRTMRTTTPSRDVTPTPSDPLGLRKDSHASVTPSTPQSQFSPRKRAALYTTPRYPRTGRPSPSTPTQVPGRKDFGVARGDDEVISIYDEIEDNDVDPAQRIWKGIDEEYSMSSCSPEGGRITRWRRLRRMGNTRPGWNEDS